LRLKVARRQVYYARDLPLDAQLYYSIVDYTSIFDRLYNNTFFREIVYCAVIP